jgi:O-antigen ligase
VTTIAELGLLGLAVIAFLFYRWGALCVRLYRQASWEDKAVVVGLAGAFLAILISSQAEGRFLEDPYLWLVFGLGVALERLRATERPLAEATTP